MTRESDEKPFKIIRQVPVLSTNPVRGKNKTLDTIYSITPSTRSATDLGAIDNFLHDDHESHTNQALAAAAQKLGLPTTPDKLSGSIAEVKRRLAAGEELEI